MFMASATDEQGWPLVNLTLGADKSALAQASYQLISIPKLDPAALVILALAVITLIIAAAWTGMDFKQMLARHEQAQHDSTSQQGSPSVPTVFNRGTAYFSFDDALRCRFQSRETGT
jgi:hypothetical protein